MATSTYLQNSHTGTGSSTGEKATMSVWVKRTDPSGDTRSTIIGARTDDNNYFKIRFADNDRLMAYGAKSGSTNLDIQTNAEFRDVFGWYHIVLQIDTTNATETERVKWYVNGELQTLRSTDKQYPSQNDVNHVTSASDINIGCNAVGSPNEHFDGTMSHFHLIDGTIYAPTVFGSTDATTGEWKINTSPNVTYGSKGFFILKDGNSVTDQSGNNNDFTVGAGTLTKTEDNPSNVFCTLNPLTNQGSYTFEHGNNSLEGNNTNDWTKGIGGTLGAKSGKYYWEVKQISGSHTDYNIFGFMKADEVMNTSANLYSSGNMNAFQTDDNTTVTIYAQTGSYANYMKISGSQIAISDGDVVSFALDLDNRKCWVAKNGVWVDDKDGNTNGSSINTSYPLWGTGEITADTFYTPASIQYYDPKCQYNFGNGYFGTTAISSEGTNASGIGKFEYDVPTGFTALSTKGLNE